MQNPLASHSRVTKWRPCSQTYWFAFGKEKREKIVVISTCLFITITAAVPKPVCASTRASKSINTSSQTLKNRRKRLIIQLNLQ